MRLAIIILLTLLLALGVAFAWADARFQRESDEAVRAIFAQLPPDEQAIVSATELERLPAPVRRWLEASGVVGKPRARTVRLRQSGQLRTAVDQPFMAAEAEQFFNVMEPAFVWRVRVKMARVLPISGRDSYRGGHGRMQISLGSLLPLVDAQGPQIDQGTLLRFLGEMVWFPSAALRPYLRWEALDENRARATMTYGGVSASGDFTFDAQGRMLRMDARRFLGGGDDARLEHWSVPARAWARVRGIEIPVEGDVVWRLASGDFNYYAWRIVDVEQNRPELYPAR